MACVATSAAATSRMARAARIYRGRGAADSSREPWRRVPRSPRHVPAQFRGARDVGLPRRGVGARVDARSRPGHGVVGGERQRVFFGSAAGPRPSFCSAAGMRPRAGTRARRRDRLCPSAGSSLYQYVCMSVNTRQNRRGVRHETDPSLFLVTLTGHALTVET